MSRPDAEARALDARGLATLFVEARTARSFIDRPVARELLEQIVELAELGPTEANGLPLRLVFVQSAAAKERLRPLLSRGNVGKTMAAPVTAIVAADLRFYEALPRLSPQLKMNDYYAGPANAATATRSALMNAAMQGAYLILAARALGLDVGPMAGFDRAATDAEFFPDGRCTSLWLANIGYADHAKTPARNPRFTFDEIARVL
jgi:3-hydroxypropanoate dehydrogenase